MPLSDNLTAWWKSDEPAGANPWLDAHVNAIHLPVINSVDSDPFVGRPPPTRNLNPTGLAPFGSFSLANNPHLVTGDIDFSFHLFHQLGSVIAGTPVIIAKESVGVGTIREYGLYWASGTGEVRFWVSSDGSNFNEVGVASTVAQFDFICCGHSAANDLIWISKNGATPITKPHTGGVNTAQNNALKIGQGGTGNNWRGYIEEMGFWKRDIRADIPTLYNGGAGRTYEYVLADSWKFLHPRGLRAGTLPNSGGTI
jgi:hypothetical protein